MEDLSNPKQRSRIEYAAQWFGFPPDSLVDTIIGDCTEIVSANLEEAKKHILKEFGQNVDKSVLDQSMKDIEGRMVEATEKVYFKLGCYAKENILTIPDDIILPDDALYHGKSEANVDVSDSKAAFESFNALCKRIKAAKVEKFKMQEKIQNFKQILERQNQLLRKVRALKQSEKFIQEGEKESLKMKEKLSELMPNLESLENNVNVANSANKRPLEIEDGASAKKFKVSDN